MSALDRIIESEFLPAITGRVAFTEDDLAMLRLPTRLGGIAIPYFRSMSQTERDASRAVTASQVDEIVNQNDSPWTRQNPERVQEADANAKKRSFIQRGTADDSEFRRLQQSASADMARRLEHLSSSGVSSWLNTLPLREHGYHLSKGDFRDALALRYDWALADVPNTCSCGKPFSSAPAMSCPTGGFPTIRHNEVRDIVADLLTEFCSHVAIEPQLAPISGEVFVSASTNTAHDARADIRAQGLWTRAQNAFLDVRVFHPDAPSYSTDHSTNFWWNMRRERSQSTPSVSSTWIVPLWSHFERRQQVVCRLCRDNDLRPVSAGVCFAAIMCDRGARSSYHRPVNALRDLAIAEGRL